ncbi:MAG: 8-amino-7-oxononanoate synthase [Candidatus Acidiferrales bacterium]
MPEPEPARIAGRMARELDDLREQLQFRALEILSGTNLCSNDYLGLARDPRLKQAVIEAVERAERVGSTGSRLLSGNSREWQELESEFTEFAGTEAALYFGSGYAANVGLLCAVLKPHDVVFSDELNHASLIDGIRISGARRVVYTHADLDHLERALRKHEAGTGAKVIVTESLFSMEGDVAPFEGLLRLAKNYGAELIVDEAHATGVCGPQGRGLAAERGCQHETLAIVHTCGKALASAGAFVCCSQALKDYLVNRARTFIFSTAMPPYLAGQIHAALHLALEADDRRAHLRKIASALREELSAAGLNFGASTTQIVPVILGSNEAALRVAAELQANGFAVKAIRPPTVPAGTARVRLSLTSSITLENIRRLAAVMDAACKSQSACIRSVHA